MSTTRSFAEEGGLMAYQEYTRDTEQRVAVFVDKILKGQACRSAGRAADHVRVGDQSQNRQDVGADHPADAPTPGGPHHRVARARPTRPAPPRSARLRRVLDAFLRIVRCGPCAPGWTPGPASATWPPPSSLEPDF